MAINPLDLMEPEETVGNLWHDYARGIDAPQLHQDQAAHLAEMRPSLTVLFRALGGPPGVEIDESPAEASDHRLSVKRKLGTYRELAPRARFDGERLRLPPDVTAFPDPALNRGVYLWLAGLGAVVDVAPRPADPLQADLQQLALMKQATARLSTLCPGLGSRFRAASEHYLSARNRPRLPKWEAAVEALARHILGDPAPLSPEHAALYETLDDPCAPRVEVAPARYMPMAPIPLWLTVAPPEVGRAAKNADHEEEEAPPPEVAGTTKRKVSTRENRDEANRDDSFIIHRFEAILSWAESLNLNRSVDDDDEDDAQKAADDQDQIAVSSHQRKTATKLRLHLDLSPEDADHERLAGEFTYPEWNHRSRDYLQDHCRVLQADADAVHDAPMLTDPAQRRRMRKVRRQFEALRPRRIVRPRQIEGVELDLDALISARVDLSATGRCSDRIYQDLRATDRDLSVGFLMDTSRSTEAAIGDTTVIEIAREALAALAGGIDASGDQLAIWGFSSLKRDRVFIKLCKAFDTPMSPEVTARIAGLRPGHYTRLGAAIRHASAMLAREDSERKLLLVLTDGKPNDLDHYEGVHGIEDSHMAVREARALGLTVHGIVIDQDGQNWFTRIFGRGGYSLLPDPQRLNQALPQIYRSLTQEV